jgi:hypothetical protein
VLAVSISIVTYVYIEPGGDVPVCGREAVSSEVESYLEAHVASLLRSAEKRLSPPARFRDRDGKDRFEALLEGSDDEFLDAAGQLAQRLHKEMDNRAKRGFFVAMRSSDTERTRAAVLKLDVHDKNAATMSRTRRGQRTLEAVKDLLDLPGNLQKGAVFRDHRAGSDVVVGDKFAETALYFLSAIDAVQMVKSGDATSAFVDAVARVTTDPARTLPVIQALETEQETTPEGFFARHPGLLQLPEQDQVIQLLHDRKRPVDRVDASNRVIQLTVTADGITIRGRASTLAGKLNVREREDGGWRILIDVEEEPRQVYR